MTETADYKQFCRVGQGRCARALEWLSALVGDEKKEPRNPKVPGPEARKTSTVRVRLQGELQTAGAITLDREARNLLILEVKSP